MLVSDLPAPVTAAKVDWIPGTTWLGFTPQGTGPDARAKCETTVRRQFADGYVLERITSVFGEPNKGHESDERVIAERARHAAQADRLVAIHRLRHSSLPLQRIVGDDEYTWLQDTWAKTDRNRWSVAFPIVETYDIVGAPRAREIFTPELYRRLFQTQSAVLRPLGDDARAAIAGLQIRRMPAPNQDIAVDQEIEFAERSNLNPQLFKWFDQDLEGCWEGETVERRVQLKKRAVWLARNYAKARETAGTLRCDECGFDGSAVLPINGVRTRSLFDVHHRTPIGEGRRYTEVSDFQLLCPTCHRITHLRMGAKSGSSSP